MKRMLFSFVLCFLSVFSAFAGNADSLSFAAYCNQGKDAVNEGDIDAARTLFRKAEKLSIEQNNLPNQYKIYGYWVSFYTDLAQEYDSAMLCSQKMLEIASQTRNDSLIADANYNLSVSYANFGYYQTSIEYLIKSLSYYEKKTDKMMMGKMYNTLAATYVELGAMDKAITYGEKAETLVKGTPRYLYTMINLAVAYAYNYPPQYPKAEKYYEQILAMLRQNPNKYLELTAYSNLADLYNRQNKWTQAEKLYNKTLVMAEEAHNDLYVGMCKQGLAYIELYKNNIAKAEQLNSEALAIARKNETLFNEQTALEFMGDLCIAKRDFVIMRRWYYMSDSVEHIITNEQILNA
ncbi:MAG: tetratricopeptide repeat protein, partial [Paludibacter sp.]|nr:tetratricopeptide repeat protein [Paludibacter sp.]